MKVMKDEECKIHSRAVKKRLLRGLITGKIQGSPEFVSPEIVRGYPLTLATDMWSAGTLTYVLLTGISPFHGDNDTETLENVSNCAYSMKGDEWRPFTAEAADFVKHLLMEIPGERMTVDEALEHPWLSDPSLKTAPLSADTLREFKYQHKWLITIAVNYTLMKTLHAPSCSGRLFRPEDLARIPHDSFGRPLDLDQRLAPGQLGRMVAPPEELRKPPPEPLQPARSPSRSTTPRAESDASTPTVSPVNTIKEGDILGDLPEKDLENPGSLPSMAMILPTPSSKNGARGLRTKISCLDASIQKKIIKAEKVLERAENDPSIPVGAPLFLEDLHSNLMVVETKPRTPSPAGLSPRRTKPGTKSPVLLSPGREHSMEVIIATKRGKPGFLPPGEVAPELDDEDAKMDERKKKARPSAHRDEFQDLREKLQREDDRRKADREQLDRYRPKNIYKDDLDFDRPGYDIDDSPWDSHYQIGPDTYLMATQGPSFNSRVRDYRRNLFGDGAPLVRQGFLGVRNQDITVRERRRYTDILREKQAGVLPKSSEHASPLQKAPSLSAIERIKADIEKGRSVCRLTISQPASFDLGEYTCIASNEYGTDKTTSCLITGGDSTVMREFETLKEGQHENVQHLIAAYQNIVHLDVNPHNVMFQSKRNWIVKLVDFGSAQSEPLNYGDKKIEISVEAIRCSQPRQYMKEWIKCSRPVRFQIECSEPISAF
ncbi:hypothetical protein TELCIR_12188 [Teladorsagia circumcincta]|uniref:Protein kinase domain-containing protein n=1 Tax=Teladorsagia circumcincta TaxID=45464 RepID=A0A2G9U8S2_TELCI|nr:hypothetical protein TELCIR_12188 [Teladorsagia circumcincta]